MNPGMLESLLDDAMRHFERIGVSSFLQPCSAADTTRLVSETAFGDPTGVQRTESPLRPKHTSGKSSTPCSFVRRAPSLNLSKSGPDGPCSWPSEFATAGIPPPHLRSSRRSRSLIRPVHETLKTSRT